MVETESQQCTNCRIPLLPENSLNWALNSPYRQTSAFSTVALGELGLGLGREPGGYLCTEELWDSIQ